ncbi:phage tail spike protein [Paraliobacillus sp. X-1268]|uniref:phage tail spike protein n=1 Tax=Paraliobacillus sp. X-1268 TaxID=2213193 RepID=UPI000E3DBA60|nr:phage tail spike protein [Paraliobacillus sp. X-1268]
MSQVFIANGQTDQALGHIRYRNVLSNSHKKSLEDGSELFDFSTHADRDYSTYIAGNNRVIIPGEDGEFLEFIIYEVQENRIDRQLEVYSYGSYAELSTAKVIQPHTSQALSAEAHGNQALDGTEWQMGTVFFNGVRTITFDDYTDPYAYLKKIASVFGLELRFRVEQQGGKIIGRYVDLVEKVGQWRGRRVEFGKDLIGLKRTENTEDIVTALEVLGPLDEDSNRLTVLVEDQDALERWGRDGKHIIKPYEPQFDVEENATEERLIELGEQELAKRINAIVSYEGTIADLEKVPGLENKKIRFGDTIQIKDTSYEPALYLEARIYYQERDIKDRAEKQVQLGDFVEYTEAEVNNIWQSLQAQLRKKISLIDLQEVTYTKPEIDEKDEPGNAAKDKLDSEVGQAVIETTTGSQTKADQAQSSAESNANNYTNTVKTQIDGELLDKAGLEYVNGELLLKADSSTVQTINNTVNNLETTASNLQQSVIDNATDLDAQDGRITTVSTNLDTVEGNLNIAISDLSTLDNTVSQQRTDINANATAINLKASQDELDTVSGDVSSLSGEVNILAGQVELKAEQSTLNSLSDDVTTISNDVSSLSVSVDGISTDVSSLEQTVDGHTTDISQANSSISQLSDEISSKVESSTFNSLEGRVDSAESTITQHSNQINAKAESSTVSSIESRVSSAELDIDGLNGQISLKANNTTVNDIESRVSSAELNIDGLDSEIDLKVNKNGVIASINLSSESATIDATNINLVGAVTVLSDITGNLGIINAGEINGIDINGSTFNSITNDRNYTRIDNNHYLTEGDYFSDGGGDGDGTVNTYAILSINNGKFSLKTGPVGSDGSRGLIDSEVSLRRGVIVNSAGGGGTFISNGAIGFNDFYDGDNRTASVFVQGNTLCLDANGTVVVQTSLRADGNLYSVGAYNTTTGASSNVYISTAGQFARVTSAKKYKTDIQAVDIDYNKILDLKPSHWFDKAEVAENDGITDGLKRYYGLIAEDVADVGLSEYVTFNGDEIEGIEYDRLWTLLIPVANDHADRINYLEMENQVLKQKVAKLEEAA